MIDNLTILIILWQKLFIRVLYPFSILLLFIKLLNHRCWRRYLFYMLVMTEIKFPNRYWRTISYLPTSDNEELKRATEQRLFKSNYFIGGIYTRNTKSWTFNAKTKLHESWERERHGKRETKVNKSMLK